MKKLILSTSNSFLFLRKTTLLFIFICFGAGVFGQVNGDYQTRVGVTGNWNVNTTWQVRSGGAWVNCAVGDYPGVAAGAGTVTILNNTNVTITANVPNAIGALTISSGANNSSVVFGGAYSLAVTGATTINGSGTNNINKFINIASGTFSSASIAMTDGNGDTRDCYISISTGTATISGAIAMAGGNLRNYFVFTNNGILYVGGNMTGGGITSVVSGAAATAPTNGTVNFNGAGAQTIPAYTYYNLTTSNNGVKTLAAANIAVNHDLNISNSSTLQIVGNNFTVSGVTNINDAGILNDNNNGGTNTFIGTVTLNGSSTFTTTAVTTAGRLIFQNGFIQNSTGAFAAGIATFNTNAQSIQLNNNGNISFANAVLVNSNLNLSGAGAGTLTFSGTVTLAAATTLTNQRETNVVGVLTGAVNSTWVNDVNSTLNYGAATLMATGVFTATAIGNTVNYNVALVQTIKAVNYFNLSIAAGARTVTLQSSGTIGVANVFSPGIVTGYTVTTSTVNFNGTVPQDIPAFTFNNLTISGGSTKTLTGAVTVGAAGVLNLNGGILELAGSNLTIANPAAAAITGTYSSTNMISTNGSGFLQKNGTAAANFIMVYPVGSGGYYSPMTISANTAVPAYIRVRAVPFPINPVYIKKYWDVNSNIALTGVTATFQYDNAELNGAAPFIDYSPDWGTTWQSPPVSGTSSFGANSFTITGNTPFRGYWTMGSGTYYSYQTGGWDDSHTWTFDPSGTTWSPITIPSSNDKVVILAGRTVTLNSNIASTNLDITINASATLDLATYQFSSTFASFAGQGMLRLASVNFPTATTNTFVNAGGGTTEYYNAANFTLPATQATYNHLNINTPIGIVATQLSNITLNGDLRVKQGTYRINDDVSTTKRILTINGNATVDANGLITVGQGPTNSTTNPIGLSGGTAPFVNYYTQFHTVIIKGNFANEGTVKFTNLDFPIFDAFPPTTAGVNSGAASVYMQGNSNNNMTLDGVTNFYNLIIDKGADQTYQLTINPSDRTYFTLFGANTSAAEGNSANPIIKKALWIKNGTLILAGSTTIASLTEGNTASDASNHSSDYIIPLNGAIILNGGAVVVLNTADDYAEVNICNSVSGGTGLVNGVNQGGYSAMQVFGKLQINSGYFSARESGGIITSDIASGQFIINGGTVDAKQFLSATGTGSYTQAGGLFILRGRFTRNLSPTNIGHITAPNANASRAINGINPDYGTFNLQNTSNIFTMSGGTIRMYDVCGDGSDAAHQKGFDVYSSSANYNVTGGTLELRTVGGSVLPNSPNFLITNNAPLYNLSIPNSGGSVVKLNTYPLIVKNDFTLSAGVFDASNLDVTIGRHFTIGVGTTYTPGTNTTTLNGTGTQTFTVNLAAALSLNKFTIDKPAATVVNFAGSQTTINVNDDFKLILGTLNDNGNTINTAKNVYNSGLHTGTGKIVLNGTLTQTIDGNGIFNNLELNNNNVAAAPVSLIANTTINGALTFSQDKQFNISTYNLKLNADATIANAGTLRYIQSAGNAGDGGITKFYSNPNSFNFPIGIVHYTPSTIGFSEAPDTYGSFTVVPVNYEHPNVINAGRSLTYHWRVRYTGFSLGATAKVTYGFQYDQSNVIDNTTTITENEYVAARFDNNTNTWTKGVLDDVDEINNIIGEPGTGSFLENVSYLEGDFTAGDDNPINPFGVTTTFYSRQSGPWTDINTWSLTGHSGLAGTTIPGASDIVIIGENDVVNLTADAHCGSLQIETGSTLDIYTWTGSTFSTVLSHPSGNGLFRLTTTITPAATPKIFLFPSNSDFSDFNNNFGTTEYYDIDGLQGALYILPANVTTYGNLMLTAMGGDNLVLPNNALTTIKGDLTCGGNSPSAWIAVSWNTHTGYYGNSTLYEPTVEKTIHITGNLNINTGTFVFMPEIVPQHLVIDSNVTIGANGYIDVIPSDGVNWGTPQGLPVANTFAIGGTLINNSAGAPYVRLLNSTYYCDVTFQGSTNASISGTGNTTFNKVNVNKGTTATTTLTCDIGGTLSTPTDNWFTIQNGTFKYIRTGDFNISIGTPFTIPTTAGLFINTPSNIYIANSNVDNNDLFLDGKLTLINGTVYIGRTNGTTVNNNDIEYSGGGSSEIEIQGGNLLVNGQIRRSIGSTNGILKYTQSGGNLVINGQNAVTTRAKLEILNAGSSFNMSGGTISIVRGGGTTFGDLYLRPTTANVTGGTILFSQTPISIWPVVDAAQTYTLDANTSLNNLTLTGKTAGTKNATLGLSVNPLVLKGTLTISNANSIFNTNNLNVTIGVDMSNSGTYNYGTNLTTFNGGSQNINGTTVTNFYDLNVSPVTKLTVNHNFTINRNLTIGSGNFELTSYLATVKGDVVNNGSYTDNNATSGLSLNGTALQQITGYGNFGRLELNNSAGAHLNNDITIQNDLVLTNGILDISQYQLSLGLGSNLGGAPFSITKMIKSDGVISSKGVRKFFNAIAAPISFTYPVGVTGKYTPAVYSITSTASVGSIAVNPINTNHSAVLDASKVLKYYWDISSSGITNFNGSLNLQYLQSDVQDNELLYVAAWLESPGIIWNKATIPDNVDETNNLITFNSTASNNLSGAYTAGIDIAIPTEVPTYQSNQNGNWSNNLIWDAVGASPPCPIGGPNGYNVIVNHIITTNVNSCKASSTTINGTLMVVAPTFGHSFGTVKGSGKLYLESGNLPAGNYNIFFDCSNDAILEYGGIGDYDIIAQYTSLPNLFISGTGTKRLPNTDLTICKRLVINGSTLDQSTNNPKLIILGTFERNAPGVFNRGTNANATVSFAGTLPQTLAGNFSGANSFYNLEINNSAGLTIGAGQVNCYGVLLLTNGVINTATNNKLFLNTNTLVLPDGGSASSYINGPLYKYMNAGTSFNFPLGKNTVKGHEYTLTTDIRAYWISEYFTPNATHTSMNSPLQVTNKLEYWDTQLYLTASANAKIKIGWDPQSDLTPLMTPNGLDDMCVATYNTGTSKWDSLTSLASGNVNIGNVETIDDKSFALGTTKSFTTGSINAAKPMASLDLASGTICGNAGIPVKFVTYITINLNYTLTYTINGVAQAPVTVSSLPYLLPTPVSGDYKLTSFKYNNGTVSGCVSNSIVKVTDLPDGANAGTNWSQCGVSGTNLSANAATAPATGKWTIVSGVGGYIYDPTLRTSYFQGILGTSYILRWTITNGTCVSYDDVEISFPIAAERPTDFTAAPTPVCQGSSGNVYTVKNVAGNTYNWSYSGTGAIINGISNPLNGASNSVTIDFSPTASNGTLSVTATNACGTSLTALTKNISLNLAPTVSVSGDDYVCQGASVSYTASEGSGPTIANYDFKVNGISVQSGASNTYTTTTLVNGDVITVDATTASNCLGTSNGITVTVDNTGTWWGRSSTNWFDVDNWPCKTIPTNVINVVIPTGAPNMPIINGAGAVCKNITIRNGATLTIQGANNFDIYGDLTNEGTITASAGKITLSGDYTKNGTATFTHGNGTFEFKGTNSQNYTSTNPTLFNNLIINNSSVAGITLNNEMQVDNNANVTFTDGLVNTTAANILTLNQGVTITINLASNVSFVNGFVKRIFGASTNSGTTGLFPIGANGYLRSSQVNFTIAPTSGGSLTGFFQTVLPAPADYYMGLPKADVDDGGVFQFVDNLPDEGFWEINSSGGLTDGEYTITLFGNGINTVNNISELRLLKRPSNGTNWQFMGTHGITTASPPSVSRTALTGFSQFSWGGFFGVNPLPISLLDFKAICENNQVKIEWTTATETNNDFFTLERSADSKLFSQIAIVKGAGNSNAIINYITSDIQPLDGVSYYRLKQTDYDGKFKYSAVISSNCAQSITIEPTVSAYPNPFNGMLFFEANNLNEDNLVIQIFDMLGKQIEIKEVKNIMGNNVTFSLDLSKYVVGVYYYRFTSGSSVKTGKIIKN